MNVTGVGITPKQINYCSDHFHNAWEIVLNLKGSGTTVVDGKSYDFSEGSVICMPPFCHHNKFSDGYFRDIYVTVDKLRLPAGEKVVLLQDDESKNIQSLMFMILEFFFKKEDNYQQIINSLVNTMHQIILSRIENSEKNPIIERFKNELIKNFTNPEYTLKNAMCDIPYSADHFRRIFKSDTGLTPNEYFTALKIEYAKQLLMQRSISGQSISEIAYLSGFYDSRYFSRIFKASVGKTPKEFYLDSAGVKER